MGKIKCKIIGCGPIRDTPISIKDLEEIVMGQLNDIDANNVINMVTLELDFIVSPNQPAMTQAVCVFYK